MQLRLKKHDYTLTIYSQMCHLPNKPISARAAINNGSIMHALLATVAAEAPLCLSVPASTMLSFPFDADSALGFTVTVTSALVTDVVANVMVLLGAGSTSS